MKFPQFCILLLVCLLTVGCTREAKIKRAVERADGYFEAGEYEKAKIAYLSVLRSDGKNISAIRNLGLIWVEQGGALSAIPFLRKTCELDPTDVQARLRLAQAFVQLGEAGRARKEALAVLEQSPENSEALLLLASTSLSKADLEETRRILGERQGDPDAKFILAKATVSFRSGDKAAGAALLEEAMSRFPESAAVHFASAQLYLSEANAEKAEEAFLKTAQFASPRTILSLALPKFYLSEGDKEKATRALEAVIAAAPNYIPAILLKAWMAAQENDFDAATDLLGQVFQMDPGNIEAQLLQGKILLGKGDPSKAIEVFKQVSNSFPRFADAKFELARAYLANASPSQAAVVLREVVELQPNRPEPQVLLAQLDLQAGEPQRVVESMQELLKNRPNLLSAQLLLSQAYRSQGNLSEAARVLREQIEATPKAPDPYLLLGLIQLQEGNRAEARRTFETLLGLVPNNILVAFHLVEMDLADRSFEAARIRAKELVDQMPDSAGARYVVARVASAQEQWDEAENALQKSIELDPNFVFAHNMLVSLYVKTGELEQAAEETEVFVARHPDNTGALLTLGVIREQLGDFEGAAATYRKVLEGNPNSTAALNNLACILAGDENTRAEAYKLASQARNLQPENAAIADTLGWIAFQRREYPQALALLQEASGKLPDNAEVQYHLGMANYMTGRLDDAERELMKALASEDIFPGKDEIPQALAMLGVGSDSAVPMTRKDLESIVENRPDDVVARGKLADHLVAEGDYAGAEALWKQAFEQDPKLAVPPRELAKLYAGPLKDPGRALEYAKKARAIAPNDPTTVQIAGSAAFKTGDYQWAYSLLNPTVQAGSAGPGILWNYAMSAYCLGKVEEARSIMQRIAANPANRSHANEAIQFLRLTDVETNPDRMESREALSDAVLKQDPENLPALMLRADNYSRSGRGDEAVRIYEGILERVPQFGLAYRGLARVYLDQPGKSDAAFEMATEARRHLPNDPESAEILAAVRYSRGEYPSVVQLLEESAAKHPLVPESQFLLGMSLLQLDRKAEGYEALEKAIAGGLGEPHKSEATSKLQGKSAG